MVSLVIFCGLFVSFGVLATAGATGPSIEIYNTDNLTTATFSITTTQSIPSFDNIHQLDLTLKDRQFCYTGV